MKLNKKEGHFHFCQAVTKVSIHKSGHELYIKTVKTNLSPSLQAIFLVSFLRIHISGSRIQRCQPTGKMIIQPYAQLRESLCCFLRVF
jgi:hypothetical protein